MNYKRKSTGFTIVELLVVIVVIAILAGITVMSYSSVQKRSNAAAIANDIKTLEKAFKTFASDEQVTSWWLDNSGGVWHGNPSIVHLASNTGLGDYFDSFSPVTTKNTSNIIYDNDGDTYNGCSTSTSGVNLYFYGMDVAIASAIDKSIDDDNLSCGRVTHSDGNMRYVISNSSVIQ